MSQYGHAPTLLFSWCVGAEVLAASGLIDGKTVTTHWGDIDRDVPLALFASQILVFHFPGVIERVKGGVPYQVPQRPLAGQFTL